MFKKTLFFLIVNLLVKRQFDIYHVIFRLGIKRQKPFDVDLLFCSRVII